MTNDKILEIARRYTVPKEESSILIDEGGNPTGETLTLMMWNFCEEELLAFAQSVIEADRESSDEPVAYLWKSYFEDTGKPIKLWLDRPEWPPGLGSPVPIVPVYTRPARKPLSAEEIREIMLENGFTIKEGCQDLKAYVYAAVRAIEKAHGIGIPNAP